MSFFFVIVFIILFRLFMGVLSSYLDRGAFFWCAFFVIGVVGGMVPLVLMKNGYFDNSVFNVLVSAIAPFYFAFEIGRLSKNM